MKLMTLFAEVSAIPAEFKNLFHPFFVVSLYLILPVSILFLLYFIYLSIKNKKEARLNEEKYRLFFEESPDPHFLLIDGVITECNRAAEVMWGFGKDDIIGRSPAYFSPQQQPGGVNSSKEVKRVLDEAAERGRGSFEWLHLNRDGKEFWIEIVLSRIQYRGHQGLIGTVRDITVRKNAEEKLSLEQKRLRQIIDLVPVFIFAKDSSGKYLIVNKAVADTYGTTVEELTGSVEIDFAPSEVEAEHFKSDDLEVMRSGKPKYIPEEKITDASGAVHILSTLKIPFIYSGTSTPAVLGVSQDITERLAAEQTLRDSEEKFRIFVENISEVIFSTNLDGVCTYISPVIEKQFGYKPEEIVGETFEKFTLAEDLQGLIEDFSKTVAGEGKPYEFRVKAVDGQVRTVITSSTLLYKNGMPAELIGVMTDITERKKQEEAYKEALNYRRAIFDQTAVGILITSTDRTIHEANQRTCELFGYTRSEMQGQSFRMFHLSDDSFRDFAVYYEILHKHGMVDLEISFRRKNGSLIRCYACGTFLDPSDTSKGIIWTFVDITELRKAEEEIRSSHQKLSMLIQQTRLAVIEWDLDFCVKDWNPAAERVFGYSREEALGKHAEFIVPESSKSEVLKTWHELVSLRGGERSLIENITKDGRIIACEWHRTPLVDGTGKAIGVISMADDVTEKKRTETALHESREKLEALVRAARDAVILINSEGNISLWNDAAARIFGYSAAEAMGEKLHLLVAPERMRDDYIRGFVKFRDRGNGPYVEQMIEMTAMKRSGEEFPIEISLASVTIGGVWSAVGIVRDITERRRIENEMRETNRQLQELTGALSYQACYDALTGIFNRRAILELLEKEYSKVKREGGSLYVGILDLDFFKGINDAYGHQTGDDILKGFVEIVSKNLREYDLLGRYGGEEFLVIASGCEKNEAEDLFLRLCNAVENTPVKSRTGEISITVSGGVCLAGLQETVDEILAASDMSLYRAKAMGRNRICFDWIGKEK